MNPKRRLPAVPYQPLFVALFVGISVYAANRLYIPAEAMIAPMCVLTGLVLLALPLLSYLGLEANKALILVTGALFLNYTYYPIHDVLALTGRVGHSPATILYAVLSSLLLAVVWRVTVPQAAVLARMLGILATSLLLVATANLAYSVVADAAERDPGHRAFEAQFQHYLQQDLSTTLNDRDFYFVILDRYPGEETMYAQRHVANRPFYDQLTALGCTVLQRSRSNYGVTSRSIPSMLNMDYYDSVKADGYNEEDNRLWRFFKSQGFTFVFLPSNWISTTRNDNADIVLNPYPIALTAASRNLVFQKIMFFERTFLGWAYYRARELVFGRKMPSQAIEALQQRIQNPGEAEFDRQFGPNHEFIRLAQTHIPRTFQALAAVPRIHGRKFVFSHINHWEYVNGPSGNPVTNVNRSVVSLVEHLVKDSDRDPVIVIMSDHGEKPDPGTVERNRGLYARYARYPRGSVDRAAILESWYPVNNVEIFCLPDGGERNLYPGMTPVNAWRMVLNYYFGTKFPRLDDRAYWKWQGGSGIIELN